MTSQPPAPYLFLVYWTWLWSGFFLETCVGVQDWGWFRKVNVNRSELDLSICDSRRLQSPANGRSAGDRKWHADFYMPD